VWGDGWGGGSLDELVASGWGGSSFGSGVRWGGWRGLESDLDVFRAVWLLVSTWGTVVVGRGRDKVSAGKHMGKGGVDCWVRGVRVRLGVLGRGVRAESGSMQHAVWRGGRVGSGGGGEGSGERGKSGVVMGVGEMRGGEQKMSVREWGAVGP